MTYSRDTRDAGNYSRDSVRSHVSMSSSWSETDRRRMDSTTSSISTKDVSAVSDWSVEVEEEDERRSLADRCATPMSDISSRALSPDHHPVSRGGAGHTAGHSSGHSAGQVAGMIKIPEQVTNPHWRPPPDTRNPSWRQDHHDPRDNVAWSAPATPSSHSAPQHHRFPGMDQPSRFAAPSHMLPHNYPAGGPGYRPPFPARLPTPSTPGSVSIAPPDWYDVYNANIYGGNNKPDINCIAEIVRADMKLRSVLQGIH